MIDRDDWICAQLAEGVGCTGGEWRLHLLLGLQVQVYRKNGERGSRRGRTAPEGGTADSTLPDDVSEKESQQRTGYSQHAEPGSCRNTWAVLSSSLLLYLICNFTYCHFLLWALNEREKEKLAFQRKLIEGLLESGMGDNRRDEISDGNGGSNSSAIKKKRKTRRSLNDRRVAERRWTRYCQVRISHD